MWIILVGMFFQQTLVMEWQLPDRQYVSQDVCMEKTMLFFEAHWQETNGLPIMLRYKCVKLPREA